MFKDLSKRKYPAVFNDNGKWFTGWDKDALSTEEIEKLKLRHPNYSEEYFENRKKVKTNEHEHRHLRLQFRQFTQGRSSVVAVMEDEDGFCYNMTLADFEHILLATQRSDNNLADFILVHEETFINVDIGTWYIGTFNQCKRGQNYFITPSEYEQTEEDW